MPRLFILCEYLTLLGGERSMLATLPSVAASGFDVAIAAPPAGPLAEELSRRGISHISWPTHDEQGQRYPLPELRASLATLLRAVRPDLLHANSLSTSRIAGPVAADARTRSIGHLRDIMKLAPQVVTDLNLHTRLLAVSHATRDFHVAQGLSQTKCQVLYNGVDLNKFHPRHRADTLRHELQLPVQSRCAAVVGQIGLRKGTDVAIEAANQLASEFADLHWLIVGERTSTKDESHEFEARLRAASSQPPLAGRVHFLGTRTDMPPLLATCDLLVHAARQEPLGRVLLEAAATGLPVVATDVGGTREIFPADTNSAVLISPDRPDQLASAVRSLLSSDSQRVALGAAARRRAESAFDIRNAAANLINHYQSVLQL